MKYRAMMLNKRTRKRIGTTSTLLNHGIEISRAFSVCYVRPYKISVINKITSAKAAKESENGEC